jgi:hypothetical protein
VRIVAGTRSVFRRVVSAGDLVGISSCNGPLQKLPFSGIR